MRNYAYFAILALLTIYISISTVGAEENIGETLFNEHCAVCHPGGGNIISPQKTLRAADLAANNITKPEDIIYVMRNPGPGMSRFDDQKIPDNFAEKLAEYILKTFK